MEMWPGHEADHLLPSSAEVKNPWSFTSPPPCVFMVCDLIKHQVMFTSLSKRVMHCCRFRTSVIALQDNLPVIHLIAKKPVGILHLLDDESNFPKATDLSFLEKCHYNHALDELYSRPRMSSMEFAVKHYAGQVWYSVDGFLDKNRDTLRQDVVDLLISSKIQVSNYVHILLIITEYKNTCNKVYYSC
jgi:hypothetical protein